LGGLPKKNTKSFGGKYSKALKKKKKNSGSAAPRPGKEGLWHSMADKL